MLISYLGCHGGPGYATPADAIKAPKEKLLYFPCIPADESKSNYLATVDVDPQSESYCKVTYCHSLRQKK